MYNIVLAEYGIPNSPTDLIRANREYKYPDQLIDLDNYNASKDKSDSANSSVSTDNDSNIEQIGINPLIKPNMQIKSEVNVTEFDSILVWLSRYSVENNFPAFVKRNLLIHSNCSLLCVKLNTNLLECFNNLIVNGFSSAPVIDNNNKCINNIDLLDVMFYILRCFSTWPEEEEYLNDPVKFGQRWNKTISLTTIQKAQVIDALDRPNWAYRNQVFTIKVGSSALSAIEIMAREHVHRLMVVNKQGNLANILTASMIIRLINENQSIFKKLLDLPVETMLGTNSKRTLITIKDDMLAVDAFKLMTEKDLTSLPIINNKSELIDCITRKDLRGLGSSNLNNFERLWTLSVKEYKNLMRIEFPEQTPHHIVAVTKEQCIKNVIEKMASENIHRVFVVHVNEHNEIFPTNMITQSDLLRFVIVKLGLKVY